jgi:hypothetical protein
VDCLTGGFRYESQFLLACDGTWVSTTFNFGEDNIAPDAIFQTTVSTSEINLIDQIARRAPSLCKSAGREPKNVFIPIAQSGEEDEKSSTTSLITGTSGSPESGIIDVWLRVTEYKKVELKDPDGKPRTIMGKVFKFREATGKYTLQRSAYDCRSRRTGTYEFSTYAAGKVTPERISIPREKLRFSSVAPGTVGETLLNWVCLVYSSPGK